MAESSFNLPSLPRTLYQFLHLLGLVLEVEKGAVAHVQAAFADVVAADVAGPAGVSVS